MTLGPLVLPFGPSPCRLAFLGEAPGKEESSALRPFVGPSGRELNRMLRMVGVTLDECWRGNVFNRQPPSNDLAAGYGTTTPSAASRALGPLTTIPATWLDDAHLPELDRLQAELAAVQPNVIIALGNTACWALGLRGGINSLRGSVHLTTIAGRSVKVLPTFHPAAILRQWDLRVIAIADLEKALNESASPDLQFDNSELWLSPTLEDLTAFTPFMAASSICATDVETKRGQITCVSFAPTVDRSICVPFWQEGPQPNYWPTLADELTAWKWVRRWIEDAALTKVLQNGVYDSQYFIVHGMKPRGFTEDCMLAHHSLYCELRKGLGFLGSVYASTPSWKSMRTAKREEVLKKDD